MELGIEVAQYIFGRADGVSDTDIRNAHEHGVSVYDYVNSKRIGVSDNDIFEAAGAGINVWHYQGFRSDGLSHVQILDYFAVAGTDHSAHVEMMVVLGNGGTVVEMMEALAAGWKPWEYGPLRERGGSHAQAMATLGGALPEVVLSDTVNFC